MAVSDFWISVVFNTSRRRNAHMRTRGTVHGWPNDARGDNAQEGGIIPNPTSPMKATWHLLAGTRSGWPHLHFRKGPSILAILNIFKQGIDSLKEMVEKVYPAPPMYLYLFRSLFGLRVLSYQLKCRVDIGALRQAGEEAMGVIAVWNNKKQPAGKSSDGLFCYWPIASDEPGWCSSLLRSPRNTGAHG